MSEDEKKFVEDSKTYAIYLKAIKTVNEFPTLQEFRWELMKEMLDRFPVLREKVRAYLKEQEKQV